MKTFMIVITKALMIINEKKQQYQNVSVICSKIN